MASSSNSEWASLPVDILHSILDYLVPMEDYLEFSEVCVGWKKAVCEKLEDLRSNHRRHCRLHQQVPLLLVTIKDHLGVRFSLYDILQGKSVREFELREIGNHWRFEGSSQGWLILFDFRTKKVTLFNPFSGKLIHLPARLDRTLPFLHYYRKRCVLSMDPDKNMDDFVLVMSARGSRRMIAFNKPGEDDWTYVENLQNLLDIACVNGIFYAVDIKNKVFSCHVSNNNNNNNNNAFKPGGIPSPVNVVDQHFEEEESRFYFNQYLVESPEGDLLRVRSNKNENRFLVYKLIWFSRNSRWEEVKDLGDVALFVGDNHPISVIASDFPGCQSNSIYFCQTYRTPNHPCGYGGRVYVFSLDNNRTPQKIYSKSPGSVLWISPNNHV